MKKMDIEKKTENDGPDEEALRVAAYYRWLERQRGEVPGDEKDDWVEAENKWRDNIVPTRND